MTDGTKLKNSFVLQIDMDASSRAAHGWYEQEVEEALQFVKLSNISWLRLILMLCTLQKVLVELCFSDASELPPAICLTMNSAPVDE